MYDPTKPLEGFRPSNPTSTVGQQLNASRKRSYHDRFEGEAQPSSFIDGQRAYKQPKRNGQAIGPENHPLENGQSSNGIGAAGQSYNALPPIPPPFQVQGAANLPLGLFQKDDSRQPHPIPPPPPFVLNPEVAGFNPNFHKHPPASQNRNHRGPRERKNERCRQFDKGRCKRGLNCPYEHAPRPLPPPYHLPPPGSAYGPLPPHIAAALQVLQTPLPVPRQLDSDLEEGEVPTDNMPFIPQVPAVLQESDSGDKGPEIILDGPPPLTFYSPAVAYFNGRGGNPGQRGRGGKRGRVKSKAPFSLDGPSHDRSITSIVVENIPESYFDEENVRQHFSQFGNIAAISMRPYKRLAVVKYDNWNSANAAHRSPQVIFNNRFVKVFWFNEEADKREAKIWEPTANGEGVPNNSDSHPAEAQEPEFDMEEFAKKQEDAQRVYVEKKKRREEIARQQEEIHRRQQELVAKQLELRAKLEEKQGTTAHGAVGESANKSTTDALRAQLRKLEAEARILGVDAIKEEEESMDGLVPHFSGFRGRAGVRGRGGRFRGGLGFRGGYGGGTFNDVHEAYAAYSLDLRPRRVALSGLDFTDAEKDEKLRHYLLVSCGMPPSIQRYGHETLISGQ
jgi:hypothetical protein